MFITINKKFRGREWARRAFFVLGFILLTVSWHNSTPARTETATEGTYSDELPSIGELKSYRFWNGVGALFCLVILIGTEVADQAVRAHKAEREPAAS